MSQTLVEVVTVQFPMQKSLAHLLTFFIV